MEQRRHSRTPLALRLAFALRGAEGPRGDARHEGVSRDLSLGGMYIETPSPAAFGAEITIYVALPGADRELALGAIVRWISSDGMGVQFAPMGARETHAIMEATSAMERG